MYLSSHNVKEFWTSAWAEHNTNWKLAERCAPFTHIMYSFLNGAGILGACAKSDGKMTTSDQYESVSRFLAGKTVLVPLCGDSAILSYMVGCRVKHVIAADLSEVALTLQRQVNFRKLPFLTKRLEPVEKTEGEILVHEAVQGDSRVTLFQGNLMDLPLYREYSELKVNFMYDRASMMAIPPNLRVSYVQAVTKIFQADTTVAYERMVRVLPKERHWGPPFMVDMDEVLEMYRQSTGREYRAVKVLGDGLASTSHPEWYAILPK